MTAAVQQRPGGQQAAKAPVMIKPFKVGVTEMDDQPYDNTLTMSTSTQAYPQYDIPSTGFLNHVYILVEATVTSSTATATGTGAVGVLVADGPWNAIDSIQFVDTTNNNIIGPVGGYDLYIINKFGGYCFSDDPKLNTDLFTTTSNATASSSAAGSFSFTLRIPVELVPRDALGSLPNKSNSTPYRVKTNLAAIATVFVSSATVGPSVRLRMVPQSYWEPTATDGSGNAVADQPPGVMTTQYWNVYGYSGIAAGNFTQSLNNSVGYPIRNLIFKLVDSSSVRATGETDWPDPFKLKYQNLTVFDRIKKLWKKQISEDYGYTAAGDAVGNKDNGIYVLPFCRDFGAKPGWETRRQYFRTTEGNRLEASGSIGGSGAHTLTVYTNFVAPGGGFSLAQITS
jgi:hypothetical protein